MSVVVDGISDSLCSEGAIALLPIGQCSEESIATKLHGCSWFCRRYPDKVGGWFLVSREAASCLLTRAGGALHSRSASQLALEVVHHSTVLCLWAEENDLRINADAYGMPGRPVKDLSSHHALF